MIGFPRASFSSCVTASLAAAAMVASGAAACGPTGELGPSGSQDGDVGGGGGGGGGGGRSGEGGQHQGGSAGAAAPGGGAGTGGTGTGGGGGQAAGGGAAAGAGGGAVPCSVNGEPGVCLHVDECTGDYAPTPGYCPDLPDDIQCCTPKGVASSCDPDVVQQPNVGLSEAAGAGGCPPGMVPVADFCIDRFEASLVYAGTGEPFSPYLNPGDANVRAVSIEGAVPQGYIDQIQADDACTMSGKRLCTDFEWLRACRGPDDFVYPYGNDLALGVCNDHRAVHPAIEYFGTSDDWIWSELGNACINQLPGSLDTCGENLGCVTVEGAFDMMGNLHEWTADPAGTFRGGFYVDTKINGPGCLYATTAHDVSHWDYSTGFRCCADL